MKSYPDKTTKMIVWQFITQADVEIINEGAILKQIGQELKITNLSHPDMNLTWFPWIRRRTNLIKKWIISKGSNSE